MNSKSGMTPEQVYLSLECMATDMTGALAGLGETDSETSELINKRISAIDFAEDLIRQKYKLRFE